MNPYFSGGVVKAYKPKKSKHKEFGHIPVKSSGKSSSGKKAPVKTFDLTKVQNQRRGGGGGRRGGKGGVKKHGFVNRGHKGYDLTKKSKPVRRNVGRSSGRGGKAIKTSGGGQGVSNLKNVYEKGVKTKVERTFKENVPVPGINSIREKFQQGFKTENVPRTATVDVNVNDFDSRKGAFEGGSGGNDEPEDNYEPEPDDEPEPDYDEPEPEDEPEPDYDEPEPEDEPEPDYDEPEPEDEPEPDYDEPEPEEDEPEPEPEDEPEPYDDEPEDDDEEW